MEPIVFKPKYSPLLWALMLLYAAPWLYGLINIAIGSASTDWKLFWLLSGTAWLLLGLRQMREILLKRIVFGSDITVEMHLQIPAVQGYEVPVRIAGGTAIFSARRVQTRYLANAGELMQIFVSLTGMEKLDVIYEGGGRWSGSWSVEKNLLSLIVFSLYMLAMLWLRIRPIKLIGPATDAMLLGWVALLAGLLIFKFINANKKKMRSEQEEKVKLG